MPGPRSTTLITSLPETSRARTETGSPPEYLAALESRLTKTRSSWAESARMKGRRSSMESLNRSRSRSRSSSAASITSSIEVQSRDGSAVPVRSRDRSSRLSTSEARRSESSTIASRSSSLSLSVIVGELSASAAARIAVIGVRRSWETVRRRAVLMSSLRRRASVSTVAPSATRDRSRRRAAPRAPARVARAGGRGALGRSRPGRPACPAGARRGKVAAAACPG